MLPSFPIPPVWTGISLASITQRKKPIPWKPYFLIPVAPSMWQCELFNSSQNESGFNWVPDSNQDKENSVSS